MNISGVATLANGSDLSKGNQACGSGGGEPDPLDFKTAYLFTKFSLGNPDIHGNDD